MNLQIFKIPTEQMNSFTKMTRIATELLTSALGGGIIGYAEEIDDYVSISRSKFNINYVTSLS